MLSKFFLLTLIFIFCANIFGQKSYLDSNFGNNGVVTTPRFVPKSICVQKDGKILVGGEIARPYNQSFSTYDYIIYRFNSDGSIDSNFGSGGKVDEFLAGSESVRGICETQDHKILALLGSVQIKFMKFMPDGSKDLSFGSNGTKGTFSNALCTANKLVQLPDGKILIVGSHKRPQGVPEDLFFYNPLIAKFDENINLDTSFYSQGYRKFDYFGDWTFTALDVSQDGEIVTGMKWNGNVLIRKFLLNGELNNSFGIGGLKTLDLGSSNDEIVDIKILPDHKLLSSCLTSSSEKRSLLVRTTNIGDTDSFYGNNGFSYIPNNSNYQEDLVQSLILKDGNVVSAVQKWKNGYDFSLLFTKDNGSIDTQIADQGEIVSQMDGDQKMTVICQQADGKILAAGYDADHMILVRYDNSNFLNVSKVGKSIVQIYPNPAHDFIKVSGKLSNVNYLIFSSSGQKVSEGIFKKVDQKIDINGLQNGVYILHIENENFKFIKD